MNIDHSPISGVVVGGSIGRDVIVNPPAQAPPKVEWWKRNGAPRVQFHPATGRRGDSGVHYDMEVTISPWPQEVSYRWRGMQRATGWSPPGSGVNDKRHLGSVDINLAAGQDDLELQAGEVAIELRFWFDSEECHFMQVWRAGEAPPAPGDERYNPRRW